eukprot:Gb_02679 [translate_table: standard]
MIKVKEIIMENSGNASNKGQKLEVMVDRSNGGGPPMSLHRVRTRGKFATSAYPFPTHASPPASRLPHALPLPYAPRMHSCYRLPAYPIPAPPPAISRSLL